MVPLASSGTYLCISFTGEPILWNGADNRPITAGDIHILRQSNRAGERRIDFGASAPLAVLIHFTSQWCQLCPGGPTCKVARFLLQGDEDQANTRDQAIELDEAGRAMASALFDIRDDDDVAPLTVEMSVLGLLSWVYTKYARPPEQRSSTISMHSRSAIKTRQAAGILRQRFDNPPTIVELSTLVGLNDSDLKRCFKCLYGTTIASYSRRNRLDTARDLLGHSALSVARIALEVGFANPSQFARAYRQQFGHNPSQHRGSPR